MTTNRTTATHATEPGKLRMMRLQLLGTFGKDGSAGALLRHPSGQTQTVRPGDQTRIGTVKTIAPGKLYVLRGGQTHVLRLPKEG